MKNIKNFLLKILFSVPVLGWRLKLFKKYREIPFPPGHYYSTIPDINIIKTETDRIFKNDKIQDINLRIEEQKVLLIQLKENYKELPYNFTDESNYDNNLRYTPNNTYYKYSDSILLFCMMRHLNPNKVIEIGSGYSSAMMLDVNSLFYKNKIEITFIEPYPEERLYSLLKAEDNLCVNIIKNRVQAVDLSLFKELDENDVLFIDSSHVSKVGSDLNFIFFEILPVLKPGVFIHFHDIFHPFELPELWIIKYQRFWNENYILRAFLMNNHDYEIILFNNFLHKKHAEWFKINMPECLIDVDETGSIWIKKVQ